MNKFKRELDDFVGDAPRFGEPLKQKILSDMKREKRPANRFGTFQAAAVLMLLLTVATVFLVVNLAGGGGNPTGPAGTTSELPALTDPDTVAEVEVVEANENTILIE